MGGFAGSFLTTEVFGEEKVVCIVDRVKRKQCLFIDRLAWLV